MLELFDLVEKGASFAGEALLANQKTLVDSMRTQFSSLDDHVLRTECKRALRSHSPIPSSPIKKPMRRSRIVSTLLGLRYRASPLVLRNIAVAAEAFSRHPADLPAGSRLYPQQVRAATALTQRYILQMDTGEGKTYALLPAAFALACEYGRVYIVCANEYLAWRDATRTRRYWNFVGIDPGLPADSYSQDWSARVIYTTL